MSGREIPRSQLLGRIAADIFPAVEITPLPGVYRAPTLLERNLPASKDLGVELLVKREDLADDFGSGHKARKLSYVLSVAQEAASTVLVTAGGLPSNQALGLAAHARRCGLRAHVVYCGDQQAKPTELRGNYLLVALLGADVTWHEFGAWENWPDYVLAVLEQERSRGEQPYLAVPGMSAWPGLLGSIDLGLELAAQLPPDDSPVHIVAAAGSMGTCLGIAIAGRALSLPWAVHGICIASPLESTADALADLRAEAVLALGSTVARTAGVRLYGEALGSGYGRPRPAELEVSRDVLMRYHLALDPTYMTKTFIGLRQLVARGDIPAGARVVLVHTGGNFGLFNQSPAVDAWVADAMAPYLASPGG